jgi:hypothetical protein
VLVSGCWQWKRGSRSAFGLAEREGDFALAVLEVGEGGEGGFLEIGPEEQRRDVAVLSADHRLGDRTAAEAFAVDEEAVWLVPAVGAMLVDPHGVLRVAVERLDECVGDPIRLCAGVDGGLPGEDSIEDRLVVFREEGGDGCGIGEA